MIKRQPLKLGRPVRRPSDTEARLAWARDLSRDSTEECGVNWNKAKRLLTMPLFDVLVAGGVDGIEEAERAARRRMVA
jgi:hypothetical protein